VHNELVDNSVQRVGYVIKNSIGTAFSVYQTIGILGYLTFGNIVEKHSNVVELCIIFSVLH
jgi:amino acid permease